MLACLCVRFGPFAKGSTTISVGGTTSHLFCVVLVHVRSWSVLDILQHLRALSLSAPRPDRWTQAA
jgi:hypothetical protein